MKLLPQDREWHSSLQHTDTLLRLAPRAAVRPPAEAAPRNRILIADDDPIARGSLAAVLESENYVVSEARDGIEAVSQALKHLPGLVLLDINMPHWDGWTAFSQLERVTPLLPVIVITARPNQYEKAVRLGVDEFMEKPLNFPLLLGAIKRLTREEGSLRMRRITNPAFVTELLVENGYEAPPPPTPDTEK